MSFLILLHLPTLIVCERRAAIANRQTISQFTYRLLSIHHVLESYRKSPHKATCPGAISAHLLCELSALVAPALSFVFQMSLNTDQIPHEWRVVYIV